MKRVCSINQDLPCIPQIGLDFLMDVSGELSKKEMNIDFILEMLKRCMDAIRVVLFIQDKNNKKTFVSAVNGLGNPDLSKIQYNIGEGIVGKTLLSGRPIIVPKIAEDKIYLNKFKMPLRMHNKDITFICIPIKEDEEVIGALSIHRYFDNVSTGYENVQLLSIIGSLIAANVRLRQKDMEELSLLKNENEQLREEVKNHAFANIQGNSSKLKQVFSLIDKVARTEATVLIRGESGVGKELIANAIHYMSARKNKPYIKVNCAALPENLIESELFGYEKGAFTGADSQHIGRFEAANGGTIFLDEFGDISKNIQVKLLRVLQERKIERIGNTKPINVNIRIICATNRNLEKMMASGAFREDLYYRINVFPIYVPSLRERLHDIPTLTDYFIHMYNKNNQKKIKRITSSAIDCLMQYHWPGNIRELQNCIERACILSTDDVIHTSNLPPTLQTAASSDTTTKGSLNVILGKAEKEIIEDTLSSTNGNIAKAAEQLSVTERIMGLRVKKYNIDAAKYKKNKN